MWWTVAGIAGALGVLLGAFGAHGLEGRVSEEMMPRWGTAAHYHLVHVLALCAVAAHPSSPRWAGALFVAGILFFSGSLYLMVLSGQRWLGAVTPIGGVCFVAGWLVLAFASRAP
ncbi:MAG: DUF423 domain-containing protein [Myxococcales bacterium]|nr:DUF423 domain-containing protein [Myxococcales bacterium]